MYTENIHTVFIRINAPGVMHFSKGGGTIIYKKNQLSSPVAMGNNGHLQPWSRLPACIMARGLNILETNLKFEEIIKFILYFCRFHCIYDHNCFVVTFFISCKRYSIGEVLKRIFFSESRNHKGAGCWEGC